MADKLQRPASGNKVLPFNMPPLPVHHINKKIEDFENLPRLPSPSVDD